MIIDPILQQYRAVMRAALQEHMNLVTSQYMTGYARASRESGIGAAMPMDPPNLSNHELGEAVFSVAHAVEVGLC